MKVLFGLIIVAVLGAIGWFSSRYFSSGHTRLTEPVRVAAAKLAELPAKLTGVPSHVVIVIEENKNYGQIAGNTRSAPYLNSLIARGALFTRSYGVAHPSQPNYLALFAGVTDSNGDSCPPVGLNLSGPNLATELTAAHHTFAGYAEDLPAPGSRACWSGEYARKHVPWADFTNVNAAENLPLSALPKNDALLPTVSFIIPNLLHDMHSASIARGDAWLRTHIGGIVNDASRNNTLVIVTWDESASLVGNHIPTIFIGPMVRHGRYAEPISHYAVLRTIEDFYGLAPLGHSAHAAPVRLR